MRHSDGGDQLRRADVIGDGEGLLATLSCRTILLFAHRIPDIGGASYGPQLHGIGAIIIPSKEETMMLPLKELAKLNQIIARIQSGRFDANDVDGLLIKLRPYAHARQVFREISHFVAHSDARDQGMSLESITSFVDSIRYFQEYTGANRQLNLGAPFPGYVFRLFLSQARLADKQQLKFKFKMSPETLIKKIKASLTVSQE